MKVLGLDFNTVSRSFLWGTLYFLFARLGLVLGFEQLNASPVWFSSGIALSALIIHGNRMMPALWFAHMAANATTLTGGIPSIIASCFIGVGGVLQAYVGKLLFLRVTGIKETFSTMIGPFHFAGTQALACLISCSVGSTALVFSGSAPHALWTSIWSVWFIGDFAGVILITPLIFILKEWNPVFYFRNSFLKSSLLGACLITITHLIFSGNQGMLPLAFLYLPVLLYLDYIVGKPHSYVFMFITVLMVIYYAVNGQGLFGQFGQTLGLILVDSFVISCQMVLLSFGAVVSSQELMRSKMCLEIEGLTSRIKGQRQILSNIKKQLKDRANLSRAREILEDLSDDD